jgi:hypothetical protein
VQKAVTVLCEAAGRGDLAAAKALVPYLDQALGRPTERVEHRQATGLEDLEFMSTEELTRIVSEGRAKRLQHELKQTHEDGEHDDDDDEPDWRSRTVE